MPARKVKSTNRELSTMVTHRAITIVLDTGAQYTMVGMRGWYIIKCHAMWIDSQGVNMGGSSKAGCHLQLVDAKGVVEKLRDGKRYLVILRQYFSVQIHTRPCWRSTKLMYMVSRYICIQGSLVTNN